MYNRKEDSDEARRGKRNKESGIRGMDDGIRKREGTKGEAVKLKESLWKTWRKPIIGE
jgi:hypothetical protein